MNSSLLIEQLKSAGIHFEKGLSEAEISTIESTFGFRFPREIASFLSCAYPAAEHFFDYRDTSPENIGKFRDFQNKIAESFEFDIEKNTAFLQKKLKDHINEIEKESFRTAVLNSLKNSPKLIPFYAHRCFIDGTDNMPILSFGQAADTVVYGYDFESYLKAEFLECPAAADDNAHEKLRSAGIWYYITKNPSI